MFMIDMYINSAQYVYGILQGLDNVSLSAPSEFPHIFIQFVCSCGLRLYAVSNFLATCRKVRGINGEGCYSWYSETKIHEPLGGILAGWKRHLMRENFKISGYTNFILFLYLY